MLRKPTLLVMDYARCFYSNAILYIDDPVIVHHVCLAPFIALQ